MLFEMYGRVYREKWNGPYEVPVVISLLGFGIMFANFHVGRMMLLFNAMLYFSVSEICEPKRSYMY